MISERAAANSDDNAVDSLKEAIGYLPGFAHWLQDGPVHGARSRSSVRNTARSVADMFDFVRGEDGLAHILVNGDGCRFQTKGTARHMWNAPFPNGSFYAIGDDVYVTSPEFSLLLMTPGMHLFDLVMLCCDVCGHYMRDGRLPKGRYRRPPLTSRKRIERFLSRVGNVRGASKLRRALKYAFDNSRSPMETAMAMLMSMPVRMGGYGFTRPLLNHHVDLDLDEQAMAGRKYMEFDVYFENANLVVEYNSDEDHSGSFALASDSRRNNTARYLGYSVITITWGEVRRMDSFNNVMRQVAHELGVSVRAPSQEALAKRRQLRAHVLPPVRCR